MPETIAETPNREKPARLEIPIDGDVLIPDLDFCRDFLQGTRKTGSRYDKQGLPFVVLSGKKYRPLEACKAWLAGRIRRLNPPRQSKGRA
jgi:hypothetical protein